LGQSRKVGWFKQAAPYDSVTRNAVEADARFGRMTSKPEANFPIADKPTRCASQPQGSRFQRFACLHRLRWMTAKQIRSQLYYREKVSHAAMFPD
jgi:hypothetical protein